MVNYFRLKLINNVPSFKNTKLGPQPLLTATVFIAPRGFFLHKDPFNKMDSCEYDHNINNNFLH